jgi:hypothetical protein
MINSKKQKELNPLDGISFDLISNKITEFAKSLSTCVEQLLHEEKKKVKIKTGSIYVGEFTAEIQEIQNTYKKHLKKGSLKAYGLIEDNNISSNKRIMIGGNSPFPVFKNMVFDVDGDGFQSTIQ